jgi:hypothetical protein
MSGIGTPHSLLPQHKGCGCHFSITLGSALCRHLAQARDKHRDCKQWLVIRPGAINHAVSWRWQASPLRPFLQKALSVAPVSLRKRQKRTPMTLNESSRRFPAAVPVNGTNHSLAEVGEDASALTNTGLRLR